MIWRDDDIQKSTKLAEFAHVDQLLVRYGQVHTIAIIANDIDENTELIEYIKANLSHIYVRLHCWEHIDLTSAANRDLAPEHLKMAVKKIEQVFGLRPGIFYPPWNRVDGHLMRHARNLGLEVSFEHDTLENYVVTGSAPTGVLNYHYWAASQVEYLEPALKRFTGRSA